MFQDVSSDVRLSMTRNARAWRAGMVTTGAAVNPIKTAALYRVSPATTPLGSATIRASFLTSAAEPVLGTQLLDFNYLYVR